MSDSALSRYEDRRRKRLLLEAIEDGAGSTGRLRRRRHSRGLLAELLGVSLGVMIFLAGLGLLYEFFF